MAATNKAKTRTDKVADVGDGMKIRFMSIGQTAAYEWLKRNSERNRTVVRSRVRQYAADMRAGRWRVSDQPITFDAEGRLVNGQHRLEACVLAGVEFPSLVLYGLPDESLLTLDGGKKRTTDDNLTMDGRDWPKGCGATVRRIMMGMKAFAGRAYTDLEVTEFMEAHGESVAFAHRVLQKGKVSRAQTRAAIARAHICKADPRRLEEFAAALTTGLMVPGDEAAILLRNAFLEEQFPTGNLRLNQVKMAESALKSFLAGVAVKKLVPAASELFPIPGDGEWDQEV